MSTKILPINVQTTSLNQVRHQTFYPLLTITIGHVWLHFIIIITAAKNKPRIKKEKHSTQFYSPNTNKVVILSEKSCQGVNMVSFFTMEPLIKDHP